MATALNTPFDSIESAYDFLRVLSEAVAEAKSDIEAELQLEPAPQPNRHGDALRIASYDLKKLEVHMNASRRILNDLRTLRRLLFAERKAARGMARSQSPIGLREPEPQILSMNPVRPLLNVAVANHSNGKRCVAA
jgi:hypothetical protein